MTNLLFQCLRIRKIEEAISDQYSGLEMRQPVHLSIGEEQVAVGVISNLSQGDKVFGGHRSHAQYLAAGGSLRDLICGLMGKNHLSSMHLSSDGMFVASTSIVGGVVPVAVGASWAAKIRGIPSVTTVFFGDGACEEGVVGEAFNFAVLHKLPVLFVCSNNGLAVTTPLKDRQANRGLSNLAAAYGLGYDVGTSSNVEDISAIARESVRLARVGKPQFLEFRTERQRVHCGIEHEYTLTNDPLEGYNTDESEITQEIEAAFEFARQSPAPTEVRGIYAA